MRPKIYAFIDQKTREIVEMIAASGDRPNSKTMFMIMERLSSTKYDGANVVVIECDNARKGDIAIVSTDGIVRMVVKRACVNH